MFLKPCQTALVWNSLPEIVISADTTDTFKRRLDKYWQRQGILYDYKVELTGIGNISQIKADDNIVIQLHFCTAYFSFANCACSRWA